MDGIELMWAVYLWLPVAFAVDLLAFHLTGDHPLAARWWWRRRGIHRGSAECCAGRASLSGTPS